jgi:hypothetical protein
LYALTSNEHQEFATVAPPNAVTPALVAAVTPSVPPNSMAAAVAL